MAALRVGDIAQEGHPWQGFCSAMGSRPGNLRGLQATMGKWKMEMFWVRGGRIDLGSSWDNSRQNLGSPNPSLSPCCFFSPYTGGNGDKY